MCGCLCEFYCFREHESERKCLLNKLFVYWHKLDEEGVELIIDSALFILITIIFC